MDRDVVSMSWSTACGIAEADCIHPVSGAASTLARTSSVRFPSLRATARMPNDSSIYGGRLPASQ